MANPTAAPPGVDDTPVPFADQVSACPYPEVTAARRLDPFWHGLWADGTQASWLSRSLLERLAADGVSRSRDVDTARTRDEAITDILGRHRAGRLTALAAVGMWRTVTAEQLAAITGLRTVLDGREMRPAFQAGLVDRGTLVTELGWRGPRRAVQLYRPAGTGLDPVTDLLGYADWVAVTGGYPWTRGHQFDRHNLLATELGVRLAEHCPVGAVLGESLSRPDLLSPGLAGDAALRSADLTAIRPDGMRIAVEITGSISREFGGKVDRWAQMLADTDPDRTGLAVVFVDACAPDRPDRVPSSMWRSIRDHVARAAHKVPGSAARRVPERMAAARWQWWSPASRAGSPAFTRLACVRPTGPADNPWRPVGLLDPDDLLGPPAGARAAESVATCNALLGVPHWLRTAHPAPGYDDVLQRRAGITAPPKLLYLDPTTMRRVHPEPVGGAANRQREA